MSAVEVPLWRRGQVVAGAIVDEENYDWLSEHIWRVAPVHRMTDDWGYVYRTGVRNPQGEQTTTSLHREVMGLKPGDAGIVHHLNFNPLDNRKENLVKCADAMEHASYHFTGAEHREITWRTTPWL